MSSTRKIEGYLTAHDDNGPGYELGNGAGFGSFWEGDATKFLPDALPVVLIIGGKGYTASEVVAMVDKMIAKVEERREEGESDLRQIRNDIKAIAAETLLTP